MQDQNTRWPREPSSRGRTWARNGAAGSRPDAAATGTGHGIATSGLFPCDGHIHSRVRSPIDSVVMPRHWSWIEIRARIRLV
jgi:hypothetical protein